MAQKKTKRRTAPAKPAPPAEEPPEEPRVEAADEPDETAGATGRWVTFDLADKVFALPVEGVDEILRIGTITRVPQSPPAVRGVTNLRGRVLPVIDLRARLGFEEAASTARGRVLVVSGAGRKVGLLVDGVRQMEPVRESAVKPPPDEVVAAHEDYIAGVCEYEEDLLILLDVERVLALEPRRGPSG